MLLHLYGMKSRSELCCLIQVENFYSRVQNGQMSNIIPHCYLERSSSIVICHNGWRCHRSIKNCLHSEHVTKADGYIYVYDKTGLKSVILFAGQHCSIGYKKGRCIPIIFFSPEDKKLCVIFICFKGCKLHYRKYVVISKQAGLSIVYLLLLLKND